MADLPGTIFTGPPRLGDPDNTLLLKIWYKLQQLTAGGGGGGVGDATAANQVLQLAQETSINTNLLSGGQKTTVVDGEGDRLEIGAVSSLAANDNGIPVAALLLGTSRTATLITVNSSGTISAGAQSVSVQFLSGFVGTFLGDTIDPAVTSGLSVPTNGNDTLGALAYTISAGSMKILKVV